MPTLRHMRERRDERHVGGVELGAAEEDSTSTASLGGMRSPPISLGDAAAGVFAGAFAEDAGPR